MLVCGAFPSNYCLLLSDLDVYFPLLILYSGNKSYHFLTPLFPFWHFFAAFGICLLFVLVSLRVWEDEFRDYRVWLSHGPWISDFFPPLK